jgi:lipoyl(octanoyl) transferase
VSRRITPYRLGRVEYEDGLKLQQRFLEARRADTATDSLLLLEHPPVLTLGRSAKGSNIVVPTARLEQEGIDVFHTDRGGDVTYHGPGQLVGYPIFNLAPDRQDVRRYVRDVEESIIRALATFGLTAAREPRYPGVWLDVGTARARKIAAIGVHISRWYTTHGFALNVRPNLSHFGLIVPCGISDAGVTSIEHELGASAPAMAEVEAAIERSFAEVFDAELLVPAAPMRTISVAVASPDGEALLLLERLPEKGGFWQLITGRIEPGESPAEAAARELYEETGQLLKVSPLDYRHSFALGEQLPPVLVEETAFAARWTAPLESVQLDSSEHRRFAWVSRAEALLRLPFMGLKRAAQAA